MLEVLAATVLTGRLAINTLPPGGYGLAAEVVKDPWVMRIDTAYALSPFDHRGIWAVTLAYPLWRLGEVQVGPLVGVNGSLPSTPGGLKQIEVIGASVPSPTVGARLSWQNDAWRITACPNVGLTGLTSPGPLGWQPGFYFPVLGCPPVLEVGYRVTTSLELQVRASYLPIGASWVF